MWVMKCEILLKIQRVLFGGYDFRDVEFVYKCYFGIMLI